MRPLFRNSIAVAVCASLLGGTGAVIAQDGGDATAVVGPRQLINAPAPSPIDFPGERGDAPGKPLRAGTTVVAHKVTITRGRQVVFPSFVIRCPAGKVFKTMGQDGEIGPQVVGRSPFVRRTAVGYRNRREWGIVVDFNERQTAVGETVTGTVYGLCR